MIEPIHHHDQMLALILRADYHAEGIQFSPPTASRSSSAI
jgi:hypothetical protein